MKRQRHAKKSEPHVNCPICGGNVEGYHFGIKSCRPCASFFRRTVASKHSYTCSLTSNCELNHKNRTMCKGCRFKRCIEAGMDVKSVQYNRDPIGSKKQKVVSKPKQPEINYNAPSTSSMASIASMTSTSSEDSTPTLLNKMLHAYYGFCRSEKSLYGLLFPDKPVESVKDYYLVKHTDFIKMERGALSFIFTLINEWFPRFCLFPNTTKMNIFRNFFANFIPMVKCYRTSVLYPSNGDSRIVMSYGQYLDEEGLEYHFQHDPDPKLSAKTSFDIYNTTRKNGNRMGQLKLRELEFIALGGLIFCVEASAVHACPEVDKMHEQIIRELHENIIQIYGYGSIGPRIGSIILLLNHCDLLKKQVGESVATHKIFNPHKLELYDD